MEFQALQLIVFGAFGGLTTYPMYDRPIFGNLVHF